MDRPTVKSLRFWRVLAVTWVGYAAYTMARRPFSVGRRAIEADTGLSKYMSSMVDTSFLILYTVGQLMYGTHIKGHTSSKNVLVLGLLGSALMCLIVAISSNALVFVGAWGLNGAFQAAGWASCMTVITPWLNASERGVVMGLWATNGAFGGGVGNTLTAHLIDAMSWRGAFAVDVAILLCVAVLMALFLRGHPNKEGVLTPQQISEGRSVEEVLRAPRTAEGEAILPASHTYRTLDAVQSAHEQHTAHEDEGTEMTRSSPPSHHRSLTFLETLSIPGVSGIAASYFFHKLVRYSLMFWLPYLFTTSLGYSVRNAGTIAAFLDIGGVVGAITAGYFSDWFMGGRRRALCALFFMAGLAVTLVTIAVCRPQLEGERGTRLAMLLSFAMGLCAFAIDSLMASTLQQDLAERQRVSSNIGDISGVVGGIGTAGSILQGVMMATLSGLSWPSLFHSLAGLTVVGGCLMAGPLRAEHRHALAAARGPVLSDDDEGDDSDGEEVPAPV